MPGSLPETPLDALSISGVLKFIVKTVHLLAHVFKFWKYPLADLSADFEEWSLLDKIYWGYKSKNPILHGQKNADVESFFKNQNRDLTLPAGFEKRTELTLAAVGDLIKVEGLQHSRNILYEKVADLIFNKDISVGNLESQLSGQLVSSYTFSDKEPPPLCCTREQYDTLKGHKGKTYTALHTAGNHTLDMGYEGLETTMARLREDGIAALGTNLTEEEQHQAKIIEKNGLKIGFVAATYGLNGKEVPDGKEYLVNVVKFHLNEKTKQEPALHLINRQIGFCKAHCCDFIIASLHWGYEYEFFPRQRQIETAHAIVEAGADLIISHHAHVIQPLEYYRPRRDPRRVAIIAYSLGNLTSNFSAPHLVLSGLLNLTIVKGGLDEDEKTLIKEARLIPVVQTESRQDDSPVFRIERLETLSAGRDPGEKKENYISTIEKYAGLILNRKEM